jgi:hypothetical protein
MKTRGSEKDPMDEDLAADEETLIADHEKCTR